MQRDATGVRRRRRSAGVAALWMAVACGPLLAAAPVASVSAVPVPASGAPVPSVSGVPGVFVESFTGAPGSPTAWDPPGWDVSVHSRDGDAWYQLEPMAADHGPHCEPPPATHHISRGYADAVFQCRDHLMTSINATGYGLIVLTPDHMVDFTTGTAVISIDVSTLRTTTRDWWDIWISPYDDALQLPLDLSASVDLAGPPRHALRVGLGTENQMVAEIYDDFTPITFPHWPHHLVTSDYFTGYETFLTPDAARRDTFEIHLSRTHLRVGMPDHDFWWIDTPIPTLDWTTGIVQLAHHSYNPTKDCGTYNNPRPPVPTCTPTTWHWDNLTIQPATPFTIIDPTPDTATPTNPTITLPTPAPPHSHLRFTANATNLRVSFDHGPWQPATPQHTATPPPPHHFTNYWTPIPTGTTTIRFTADPPPHGGPWHARNTSIFSRTTVPAAAPATPERPPGHVTGPMRLLDSRDGPGRRAPGSVTRVAIPAGAGTGTAVALNVTVTEPSGDGFVTIFPCGSTVPPTSTVNFRGGETIAAGAVVGVGPDGHVCAYTSQRTHLVVDIDAALGDALQPVQPARLHDSRLLGEPAAAGSVTEVQLPGPPGAGATLTVTVADPARAGFLTVWPCGTPRPLASNLNYVAGDVIANAAVTAGGAGGRACVFTSASTHLVVDVTSTIAPGSRFAPLGPVRLLDTRPGHATVDGTGAGAGRRPAGSVTEVPVVGRGGVYAGATAVAVNLTAVAPDGAGFVSAYPCGTPIPATSSLNLERGRTIANAVVVRVGSGGRICLYSSAGTDLVVDATAALAPPATAALAHRAPASSSMVCAIRG